MRATISIQSPDELRALLGINDSHTRLFRAEYNVAVTVRNGELHIDGDEADVAAAHKAALELLNRFRATGRLDEAEVEQMLRTGGTQGMPASEADVLLRNRMGRPVVPRSDGQRVYVQALQMAEVVFAIGPAGTGKTYLAVATAVRMLRDGVVKRLVLTRPAVEAGEKLGFLPGTFEAKVNPYLRPLYDALYDVLEPAQIRKFAENDVIEVAPLAYMRGRTLANAFVILDEAQNTTPGQMKMFLTRMGDGSRFVVTGDITQVDLPATTVSGLVHAADLLRDAPGVAFCRFDKRDVVRHPIVQTIIAAYEQEQQE